MLVLGDTVSLKTILSVSEPTRPRKAALIVLGAFLTGAFWRFRGEHGYGSSWGLLTVGIAVLLLIFALYGFRRKIDILLLSASAVSFMFTTPGWGTLNSQITGVLGGGVYDQNWQQVRVFINPFSGVFIMLCLGFGLCTFFAFSLGRYFSDKPYTLKDLALLVGVFLFAELACRLALSHIILDLVQPQAGDLFRFGLSEAGADGTPWSVYVRHFFDYPWSKSFHGGRNYFTSVNTVASAISAAAVGLTVRFVLKDAKTARIMLSICAAFAFAITFADLSLFFSNGGYRMEHHYDLLIKFSGWGMWEYFTGFFAGGLIMLIVVRQPFTPLLAGAHIEEPLTARLPNAVYGFLNFALTFVMCFSVVQIRPFVARYEESPLYLPLYAGLSALFLILSLFIIRKYGVGLKRLKVRRLCMAALPVYYTLHTLNYLFAGTQDMQNFRRSGDIANRLVLISFAVFVLLYPFLVYPILKKRKA